ncbi:MAG: alcohol dehydrogenase catalytic domain-containing protein [Phycisphaerae bacterium]|nr:alcohol dehydrogenase catalytic domain-containing protein [Phycisphaerae bacterium]
MTATMKAVIVRAPNDFAVEDVSRPECPRGGLLLKVLACGLCGSDLRTLCHGHHRVTLPWTIGHEISGCVVETGFSGAGPWKPGDMLAVGPLVFCGRCDFCFDGRYELCDGYREIAQHWPGGFAEYIAIAPEAVERGVIQHIPAGLDPAIAAVAEPISSCIHAQEQGQIGLGDTVAVIGVGPIGSMHLELARLRGAWRTLAIDIDVSRLKLCEDYAPDEVIDAARTDAVAEVRRITQGRGADVVITANASPAAQVQAVEMARKGGRILLFGGLPQDQARPGIDTNLIHYNMLRVIGTTIFAPRHYAMALHLLAGGRIDGQRFVTHRFGLADFRQGVELAMQGKVRKAVFIP